MVSFNNFLVRAVKPPVAVIVMPEFKDLLFYLLRNAKSLSIIVRIPVIDEFATKQEVNVG